MKPVAVDFNVRLRVKVGVGVAANVGATFQDADPITLPSGVLRNGEAKKTTPYDNKIC